MVINSLRILLSLVFAAALFGASPRVESVEPDSGQVGAELVAKGEALDARQVSAFYLTDGEHDHKAEMKEQTSESIRFVIPAKVPPGRYALMLETRGANASWLQQPVFCTVLE